MHAVHTYYSLSGDKRSYLVILGGFNNSVISPPLIECCFKLMLRIIYRIHKILVLFDVELSPKMTTIFS